MAKITVQNESRNLLRELVERNTLLQDKVRMLELGIDLLRE